MTQKMILAPSSCDEPTSGLHYTCTHLAKMKGIYSLSSSSDVNPHCKKFREVEGSVCQKCYAQRTMFYRRSLKEPLSENTWILTETLLEKEQIPLISTLLFRFESMGELINATQVMNYFRIAAANPDVKCALWTKLPGIIQEALDMGARKPRNLQIVQSSLMLNHPSAPTHTFVDKVFTVYTREFLQEHPEVKINCGARSCLNCRLCYTRQKSLTFVNELLK